MPEVGEAIESVEGSHKHDAFTNRVALTIAVLASFVAVMGAVAVSGVVVG